MGRGEGLVLEVGGRKASKKIERRFSPQLNNIKRFLFFIRDSRCCSLPINNYSAAALCWAVFIIRSLVDKSRKKSAYDSHHELPLDN